MIQKKQKLTKQFLLNFKRSHGQLYQKFIQNLKGKVHFGRQIKQHKSCPNYMITQKCIFLSILQRKYFKYKEGQQFDLMELNQLLKGYRQNITISINNQKQSFLYKPYKSKKLNFQRIQQTILEIITRQNFAFNSFDILQYTYIYELLKAITNKSQEIKLFGYQKYSPFIYTQNDLKKIGSVFNQKIVLIDYNSSKNPKLPDVFDHQTINILRVQDKYLIMYAKQPKDIQILQETTMTLKQVQQLFNNNQNPKQQHQQQQGFFSKLLGNDSQNHLSKSTIKMFPDQLQCSKCNGKNSQFDFLTWNYQNFCSQCLQSPFLDTSMIPSTLIQKFFKQRGVIFTDYQIRCAQCTGYTSIKKYNPAFKPKKYTCQICQHKICLQHNQYIYKCFCQCRSCEIPTVHIADKQITVCQRCKIKYCRKCNKAQNLFCQCICKKCYQLKQEQNHICRQICHLCYNHINKMKICSCGHKLCYGCYYFKLKVQNIKNGPIQCTGPSNYN